MCMQASVLQGKGPWKADLIERLSCEKRAYSTLLAHYSTYIVDLLTFRSVFTFVDFMCLIVAAVAEHCLYFGSVLRDDVCVHFHSPRLRCNIIINALHSLMQTPMECIEPTLDTRLLCTC